MNLKYSLLAVLVVLLAGLYLFPQAPSAVFSSAVEQVTPEQIGAYEQYLITYADPILNFSLRYPKGYVAESVEGQAFVFYSPSPSGYSESFIISAVNDTSEDLEAAITEEYEGAKKTSQARVSANSKTVERRHYSIPPTEGLEEMHLVQSLVPCSNYSLYYLAVIPDSVKEDVGLADYILTSLSC
ncbi:hypothetical protein HZC09_03800 [Candidatus Micrarchaeota archaeon]|nr:hypothetical protein [Candidatus Micrarchaeota archaeon]